MQKSSQYLLVTEYEVDPSKQKKTIEKWYECFNAEKNVRTLYYNEKMHSLLEIYGFSDLTQLNQELIVQSKSSYAQQILPWMDSDWRRQVLGLKDIVIDQNGIIPNSLYLQLRYIEVPLKKYEEYDNWRKNTIFKYVRQKEQIKSFLAYHTILSTRPGVMFICGFDCPTEDYLEIFSADEFQKISNEAKNKYIYNGPNGLFTKVYQQA